MSDLAEGRFACVNRVRSEILFDSKQLVVLRNSVSSVWSAGFDLSAVGGNCKISNGGVFGLTGSVTHDAGVASAIATASDSAV